MTSVMIVSFTLCMGLALPLLAHPLILGLSIMMLALFNSVMISLFQSSWYGYILFLIFVGGLLVMFAYVAALCPNLLFEQSVLFLVLLVFMGGLSYMIYNIYFMDIKIFGDMNFMNYKLMSAFGMELASLNMISVLIGLGLILLINLIAVVKICYFQQGSLRPFKS
uniref:NADH dehydrogenase subunit 6 n=1 Tax=Epitonium scalare TaxID=494602 RepID=A0A6B9MUA5_9CAEN|nr:NADH dehydrogenase subunit 6 [Epitonium scalare]